MSSMNTNRICTRSSTSVRPPSGRTWRIGAVLAILVSASALPAAAQRTAIPSTPAPAPRATTAKPPAPASTAPRTTTLTAITPEYRLGSGDKLKIEVFGAPDLSPAVQVRPDGKITMPYVGDVDALGLRPIELRDRLTEALKEYVNSPVVTVMVVEATAATAFVVGEVQQQGPIVLNGNTTVLQAIALAGGLTDWANKNKIRILRHGPTGEQVIPVNYRAAMEGRGTPVYIRPGDTLVVPE